MPSPADAFDVIVIGAGVHGAAAARGLTERGAAVLVLDRARPAGGPTGWSSGVCRAYYTDQFLAACAQESIDEMRDGALAGEAGFQQTGGLYLHGPDEADTIATLVPALNRHGGTFELLDSADVVRRFGNEPGSLGDIALDDVAIAVHERGAGFADPYLTTRALLDHARRTGKVTLTTHTSVERLELTGDGAIVVLAGGESRRAPRVLVAAGPWTGRLLGAAGIDLPLTVERHVVAPFGGPASTVTTAFVVDVANDYYLRPDPARSGMLGHLTPGRPTDPDQVDERLHDDEALGLLAAAARRLPRLTDAEPRPGWASLYDVSPDWQPVAGEVAPGVFVDAGTSGHGFKLAPAWGRHVAGLVLGDRHPELARFSPARFAENRPLAAGFGAARIIG